jgi:dihydroorotate dehydrogenase
MFRSDEAVVAIPNLQTSILGNLVLPDPFMIASSHWTSTDGAFRKLASVSPSAVTLKTTSERTGGDGRPSEGKERKKVRLQNPFGSTFAYYTDGPKQLEHWNLETTAKMTPVAKERLSGSVIGLSVLADEDYVLAGRSLDLGFYGYVELNWKYTFRGKDRTPEQLLEDVCGDVGAFFDVFGSLPVLVKLSRESLRHLQSPGFHRILGLIKDRGGALIVANTLRARVPPSRVPQHHASELNKGVVFGEHLFIDTYNALRNLRELATEQSVPVPPLVASGGIIDIGSVVDAVAAGADAVQLCSAIDLRTVRVLETMREELNSLVAPYGTFTNFAAAVRADAAAWRDVAVKARRFELDERRLIQETLSDPGKVNDLIKAALKAECTIDEPAADPKEHGPLGVPYRFAITYGNISACILANHCVHRLRLRAMDMENMSAFRDSLKRPQFQYDFTIIPEASLLSIQAEGEAALGPRYPDVVGQVASSIMELVGVKTLARDRISAIYHFSGSSAIETVKRLKEEVQAPTEELSIAACYPLFKFWKPDNVILAKPPLSCFYGLFTPPDVAKEWGAIWTHKEPLLLVASKRTLSDEGGKQAAQKVLETIEAERQAICKDPEYALRSVDQSGFVRYCAKLLGSKENF